MKNSYRLYRRRGGVYYAEDVETRRQESLKTKDKATAVQLLKAKNAAAQQPSLNCPCPGLVDYQWGSVWGKKTRHERG